MFSTNALKFFFILFFASLILSSCSFWQTSQNTNKNSNTFVAEELKSEIPFENKEPEIFQAEIVLTNFINGEKTERITKAARKGEKMRYDYPNETSFLKIKDNEQFLFETEKKIYAQSQAKANVLVQTGETLKDFLTTEWLNEKRDAKFENLGAENGFAKYRVRLDENTNSEVLIYVDENLKFPVKQEFYFINGEQKTLVSVMEIRNLKFEVDESVFGLPKDYKRLSLREFQEEIRRKRN